MECPAATPADVDVSIREGLEAMGQKAAELGRDATDQSTGTGFKVLGGFENKPVQKVLLLFNHLLLVYSKAIVIIKSFLFVC